MATDEIERLQARIADLREELAREDERAEQAEARAEDLAAELEDTVPQADRIRAWSARRKVMGQCVDVEELARDIEEKVWEFVDR
jgi:chromosome segregation ATPase